MTTIEFERVRETRGTNIATGFIASAASGLVRAVQRWNRQRRDRAAFLTLLGKEEWVYRDLGINRADVEWAARLPMQVNAARELDKIRDRSLRNW